MKRKREGKGGTLRRGGCGCDGGGHWGLKERAVAREGECEEVIERECRSTEEKEENVGCAVVPRRTTDRASLSFLPSCVRLGRTTVRPIVCSFKSYRIVMQHYCIVVQLKNLSTLPKDTIFTERSTNPCSATPFFISTIFLCSRFFFFLYFFFFLLPFFVSSEKA